MFKNQAIMIRIIFILLIILLFNVSGLAQTKVQKDNILIPNSFPLQYFIDLKEGCDSLDILESYNKSNFNFIEYIFSKALNGEISVYDLESMNGKIQISDMNVQKLEVAQIEARLDIPKEKFYSVDKIRNIVELEIQAEFKLEDIIEMGFTEEWELNDSNFMLSKNVLAYRFVKRLNNNKKLITFDVIPESNDNNMPKWEHVCTKAYDIKIFASSYEDFEQMTPEERNEFRTYKGLFNDLNPFWNYYVYEKLVSTIFDKVRNGHVQTFDFITKQEIDFHEVKKRMGAQPFSFQTYDDDGNQITKTIEGELNQNEIKSIIFIEDWYFDKKTLALKKQIKGIAPVRHYINNDTGELNKMIVFTFFLTN